MKKKIMILVGGGVIALMMGIVGMEIVYAGKVFPGVSAGGVLLGNRSTDEVKMVMDERFKKVNEFTLVHGTQNWVVSGEELGLTYNSGETTSRAIRFGRSGKIIKDLGDRFEAARSGVAIEVAYTMDEAKLNEVMERIGSELNIPAQEPEVTATLVGVNVSSGENGQEVDYSELKQRMYEAVRRTNTKIEVPLILLTPKLSEEQIARARERAVTMLGKKLTIAHEAEQQTWDIGQELILVWLDPATQTGWKRGKIEEWVKELAGTIDKPAQNATFRFVGGGKVEEFRPAKQGFVVKQNQLVDSVVTGLMDMEMGGELGIGLPVHIPISVAEPEITTADVNDLGIKELIGKGESWYAGSITNRIFNLKKAADALNGVLVPPGETFSFNQTVGDISAATGYKQAYIIKGGQTILGDGGGVCQTSSTLFRATLAAGLPIDARTAHAYRVSYYEQNYQVGFDATVFQPAPDFKFTNDTPGHILIQTEFDEAKKYLAFSIYGTSDGRQVEMSKARVWDVTPPPPDLFIDDPNLPVGVVQQTEHRSSGSKVAFDWKVTRGEEVLQERTFFSSYRPWQAVYLRGTKVN